MKATKLIQTLIPVLIESGVSVSLICDSTVGEDNLIGYFSHEDQALSVAVFAKDGIFTLVHEFHHFLQWRDRNKWYLDRVKKYQKFEEYLKDVDRDIKVFGHHSKDLEAGFKAYLELEVDCEISTVNYLIDNEICSRAQIKKYIVGANTYLLKIAGCYALEKQYYQIKLDKNLIINDTYIYSVTDIMNLKSKRIFQ